MARDVKASSTFIPPSRLVMDKNEFLARSSNPMKSVISRPSSSHNQLG